MRKLDGKAVTAGGSVGSSGPLALFSLALNIDTPNRWEDLHKREAIARDILISIRALRFANKSMQPTAKASAD